MTNQVAARGVRAVLIPGVNGVGPSSTVHERRTILLPAVATLGPAECVGCGVEGAVGAAGVVVGAPASGSRSRLPLQSLHPGMHRCVIPSGAGVSSVAGSPIAAALLSRCALE